MQNIDLKNINLRNIDLRKVKKEYLSLACLILIVVVIFFAYKNVFSPLLGRVRKTSAEIKMRARRIQGAKISPEALMELEEETEKLNKEIGQYRSRLQARADVPQILKELNRMAEHLEIKFVSVAPLERESTLLPGEEELLLKLPIKIKLQGGYHQLGIFINQIENAPSFMKITELKINGNPRETWKHDAELVITSYRLVAKK